MIKASINTLNSLGYSQLKAVYSLKQINAIKVELNAYFSNQQKESFAIRQLLKKLPQLKNLLFTDELKQILDSNFKQPAFLTKALYFNKPPHSNWFVSYHQDLSISVQEKIETPHYVQWTNKKGQIGVVPPLYILNNILTIRIHLDDTTKDNGALYVIPNSHSKGIIRSEHFQQYTSLEVLCDAEAGDLLLMKPLTLHSSYKTKNNKPRRIIHLEFSSEYLDKPLKWLESERI